MKTSRENIPAIVQQIGNSILDSTNKIYVRENYRMTLVSIRNYCDEIIGTYDKNSLKEEAKKKRA